MLKPRLSVDVVVDVAESVLANALDAIKEALVVDVAVRGRASPRNTRDVVVLVVVTLSPTDLVNDAALEEEAATVRLTFRLSVATVVEVAARALATAFVAIMLAEVVEVADSALDTSREMVAVVALVTDTVRLTRLLNVGVPVLLVESDLPADRTSDATVVEVADSALAIAVVAMREAVVTDVTDILLRTDLTIDTATVEVTDKGRPTLRTKLTLTVLVDESGLPTDLISDAVDDAVADSVFGMLFIRLDVVLDVTDSVLANCRVREAVAELLTLRVLLALRTIDTVADDVAGSARCSVFSAVRVAVAVEDATRAFGMLFTRLAVVLEVTDTVRPTRRVREDPVALVTLRVFGILRTN